MDSLFTETIGFKSASRLSIVLFILVGFVVVGVTALAALQNQREKGEGRGPRKSQQMIEAESRLPAAIYDAPYPADPKEQQERLAREKKFETSDLVIDPSADVVTSTGHWASGLSDIPAGESDAIIVGDITDARAYTTHDRKRVYSEFSVRVVEVLKNDGRHPIRTHSVVEVGRIGGRVKFPGGRVGQYFIVGQGMPQVGRAYLLFLTRGAGRGDYAILTGYELRDGVVHLLDNPGSGHPIAARGGSDAASFLGEVRFAVSRL